MEDMFSKKIICCGAVASGAAKSLAETSNSSALLAKGAIIAGMPNQPKAQELITALEKAATACFEANTLLEGLNAETF